jgi:small-conductance mechanosensitive channel
MRTVFDYVVVHWLDVIPLAVFAVSIIALFWLRKIALEWLEKWSKKINWSIGNTLIPSLSGPFSILCLVLSIYLAITVANIPDSWKTPASRGLWSLFVISITSTLLNLTTQFILYYSRKFKLTKRLTMITRNVTNVIILVVALLTILTIWGITASLVLLLIAMVIIIGLIAFRDTAPNLFASFQIAAAQEIKIGDYIKLDTDDEGYVSEIGWNTTHLKSLDGSMILIPNSILVRRKIINYGHPLKRASEPFYFKTQTHMTDLTGLKASNLQELVKIVKQAPDSTIYYHSHRYLEEQQYLVPRPSNDFSRWVKEALENAELAEKLANLNIFKLKSLPAFKDKMVHIIEEYLQHNQYQRELVKGREFYFMDSVSVILPTTYAAHDLRELVESLRKISPASLYFHIFESRLRLEGDLNDFAVWLDKSMGEPELSREVTSIDPCAISLEGLRSSLVQAIEKRIK